MSTSTEQEFQTTADQNLTVGQTLQQAREKKNLTLEDVNKTLRINIRILQSFENDHFIIDDFALVYLKAYLKKYSELLGLDPVELDKRAFPEKNKSNTRKTENVTTKPRTVIQSEVYVREKNPNVIRRIYFIVLTIAILTLVGFIIYKTLNDNKGVSTINTQDNSALIDNSNNTANSDNTNINNSNVVTDNNSDNQTNSDNSNSSDNNSNDLNSTNNSQDNNSTSDNSNPTSTDASANQNNADTNLTTNDNNTDNSAPVDQDNAASNTIDYAKLPAQGTYDSNNLDIPNKGLYIIMKADSWNRVIDNNKGKTIYAKVFSKGTYLYIYQPGSYSVRIGKPYQVEVYYNGKRLELKPNSSRVANFTVGK